jgi:elongation factor G
LKRGERSQWHRIDIAELWHFYAGAPLLLRRYDGSSPTQSVRLGTDLAAGERPQALIPVGHWQTAESLGDWTLVGCTVAPGFRFEGWELAPDPVLEIPINLNADADQERWGTALKSVAADDPFFRVRIDNASGETVIAGMSELQLDTIIRGLKRDFQMTVGAPQVAYRETIRKAAEIDYTHKRQTGGTGQFARVKLAIEPNEAGAGFEFENEIIGGSVPREYVPGIEKGLNSVQTSGPIGSFPVVGVKVRLIDGAYHEVDSSAIAFEIAARAAFREGLQRADPVLLEPIMKVEVVSPEDYVRSVIGDLNSRGGQIRGRDIRGNATVITAFVPLANMLGYVNNLRSMSQGRASYTMQFDHYAPMPRPDDDPTFPSAIGMRA